MSGVDDARADLVAIRSRGRPVNREVIQSSVRSILVAIGEDPEREGLKETPERVAEMYEEIFAGIGVEAEGEISVTFAANHDQMILVRDIPLYSVCEHHLIPFMGRAHVAYIPNETGSVTGLSKIARLVDVVARRPQLQERLTTEVAAALETALRPRGVFVVVEAEHLCMTMRGVHKAGTTTVTSAVRGMFAEKEATRAEAMALVFGASRRPGSA